MKSLAAGMVLLTALRADCSELAVGMEEILHKAAKEWGVAPCPTSELPFFEGQNVAGFCDGLPSLGQVVKLDW